MKWFFLLIVSLVFCGARANSDSGLTPARKAFFHSLNSNFMEVVEEGSPYYDESLGDYPFLARIIQMDLFKWDPSGKTKRNIPACDPDNWKRKVLDPKISSEQLTSDFEKILHDCDENWETGRRDLLSNSLGIISLKLHPNRYPYGRHVIFHLTNQIKLKGLLAMKTDGKKRPLVIFRTGIFSNTQEFYPERFLFMQLFEQSPFNMLVLESLSGSEFLKHNTSYALGGFDEGLQNFLVAQKLQDPQEPISKSISEVHMMGLSMGGHGALFSALLNQMNSPSKPVIQSVLTFCPLINMQETLDYHMSQGFSMDLMNYWASRRLKVLKDRIPGLKDDTFIPQFFNWIRDNYKGPLIAENGKVPGVNLPQGMQELLDSPTKPDNYFWRLNHFWPWYQNVKTPVVIFSTRKDPIVSWFINSGRIEDHRLQFADSNLKMFSFLQGYHCSLPVAYDWGTLSTLFQTYFLKMSPHYQSVSREIRAPLTQKVLENFKDKPAYLDLSFEATQGTSGLEAVVRFDHEFTPSFSERILAPRMSVQLPLSEMEFPIESVVRNEDESSLLKRWAYQNIRAHIEGSDLVFQWQVTK